MKSVDFDQLFLAVSKLKVAVLGDVMLDTYWWGTVERISPEAPVPIVAVNKREQRIGGAGNVALNLQELGAKVALLTLVGDDDDGVQLCQLLRDHHIDTRFILESQRRITTNKIRIISRNQQMMRLDAENTDDLDEPDEVKLVHQIEKYILLEKPDIVILEDYNKGILTRRVIAHTIELCNKHAIATAVDPKRKNFFTYRHASIFKPNFHEAMSSLNLIPGEVTAELLTEVHEQIKERLDHQLSLITLSEKGIFYQEGTRKRLIPSHRRNISDVSGAGDTVIAVAAAVYAVTKDRDLVAEIANIAGGIVCEEVGTVAINREKLIDECKRLLSNDY